MRFGARNSVTFKGPVAYLNKAQMRQAWYSTKKSLEWVFLQRGLQLSLHFLPFACDPVQCCYPSSSSTNVRGMSKV